MEFQSYFPDGGLRLPCGYMRSLRVLFKKMEVPTGTPETKEPQMQDLLRGVKANPLHLEANRRCLCHILFRAQGVGLGV